MGELDEFFDLHCDTVTEAFERSVSVTDEQMQLKVKNNGLFKKYTACFSVFTNDSYSAEEAVKRADKIYAVYRSSMPLLSGVTPLLTVENAAALGGDKNNIALWKSRGVCMMSLCWNGENELACGAHCESGGLKPFGRAVIRELERQGIALDLAHINRGGFFEAVSAAQKPFAVSHSCCDSVKAHRRNLTDEQIRLIIKHGGVMGLCFYPEFAGGDVFSGVYKNIRRILRLGGEDIICFGSDFDGAKMSGKLKTSEDVPSLYCYLEKKGLEKELLSKFFYKNAENFFINILHNG